MKIIISPRQLLVSILLLSVSAAGLNAAIIDAGRITTTHARFTVITPECIRLEYSAAGEFVDVPSYFAVNRDARDTAAQIKASDNQIVIDTGIIKLEYTDNAQPFNRENLKATIHGLDKTAEWRPGDTNSEN